MRVDVSELFHYVRGLPDVVSDDTVSWNSRPASLMTGGSDWGSLLARDIWSTIVELCVNSETIIREYPNRNESAQNAKIFRRHIGNLEALAERLRRCQVAIWDTDVEALEHTIRQWEMCKSSEGLLMLPHMQRELRTYAEEEQGRRKKALKEIAKCNKALKRHR